MTRMLIKQHSMRLHVPKKFKLNSHAANCPIAIPANRKENSPAYQSGDISSKRTRSMHAVAMNMKCVIVSIKRNTTQTTCNDVETNGRKIRPSVQQNERRSLKVFSNAYSN